MKTSFEQLIDQGILIRDEPTGDLERDGFLSYVINDDYVIRIENNTATYAQICVTEHNTHIWVIQLEGQPEDPINASLNTEVELDLFKRI